MFKCKKIEDTVMLQEYLEELNKNDSTHLPEVLDIAEIEINNIELLRENKISYSEYEHTSRLQSVYDYENFLRLFRRAIGKYIYNKCINCDYKSLDERFDYLINYLATYVIYTDNQLDALYEHIKFNVYNMTSYYEDEDLEYEVNYEEDTSTINASVYPYQLFL